MPHGADPADGRWVILVKCRIECETDAITDIYDRSYFWDVFSEQRLREYLEELKKIWNQETQVCLEVNNCMAEQSLVFFGGK